MLKLILPVEYAPQHTAIQDAVVRLMQPLKWTVVADWRLVTPGYGEELTLAQYRNQEFAVVLIGRDGKDQRGLRIVVVYVTSEYETEELYALITEAIREVAGTDVWKLISASA